MGFFFSVSSSGVPSIPSGKDFSISSPNFPSCGCALPSRQPVAGRPFSPFPFPPARSIGKSDTPTTGVFVPKRDLFLPPPTPVPGVSGRAVFFSFLPPPHVMHLSNAELG